MKTTTTTSAVALSVLAVCTIAAAVGALTGLSYLLIPQSATTLIALATIAVMAVLPFVFAPLVYGYLRSRLTKNSEILTTVILTLGFCIGLALGLTSFGNASGWGFLAQALFVGLPIQFLFCLAAVGFAKKLRSRKHDMSIAD